MIWLDDIKAVYGKPRVATGPVRRAGLEDDPEHEITSWVWFPGEVNHCVTIKRYLGSLSVRVSSHARKPQVEAVFHDEPTDDQMRMLLALTGFCDPGEES